MSNPNVQGNRDVSKQYLFADSELHTAENLMYNDAPLTPKMISSLMHISTNLESTYQHELEERRQNKHSLTYVSGLFFLAIIFSLILIAVLAYFHNIGPFYNPEVSSVH